MTGDEKGKIRKDFREAANMRPARLATWGETADSKRVGWKEEDGKGSGKSVGHHYGHRIVKIERKKKVDLTPQDYAHMEKVIDYVARHRAQGPAENMQHSH